MILVNPAQELQLDLVTHTYTRRGQVLPSTTEILANLGFINKGSYECRRWPCSHPDHPNEARNRGTRVHTWTHYLDENDLDWASVDPAEEGYVWAWMQFKKDCGFKVQIIEVPWCNPDHGVAGCLDRAGILVSGSVTGPAIVDIKTGGPQDWWALQLASYDWMVPEYALSQPGPRHRLAVQLNADGGYKVHPFNDPNDRGQWLACVSNFNWKRNHA